MKLAGPAARSSRFQAVVARIRGAAAQIGRHAPARRKAAEAQAAALASPRERSAGAETNQVAAMQEAEARKPEKGGFLAQLRKAIEQVMPKTLDDATRFMGEGQKASLKGAVEGEVGKEQAAASGPTQDAAAAKPDEAKVPAREVAPMPQDPAPASPPVDVAGAVPEPRPAQALAAFEGSTRDAEQRMKAAELTPGRLQQANDPRFTKVLTARSGLVAQASAAPGQYRAAEAGALGQAAAAVQGHGKAGVLALLGVRGRSDAAVRSRQQAAKQRDEVRRREVAETIGRIYAETKKAVETRLDGLERDALALFDAGADVALGRMKEYADAEIARFKEERYAGVTGKARWVKDLFSDPPEGVKLVLRRARDRFVSEMDALAVRIADTVDRRVADAKAEVARGQQRVASYVAGLPKDLQAAGKAAEREVAGRFDELRAGVDARQEDLARKLGDKYKEATEKADAELKKLEDASKGRLKGLVDAVGDVVKAIAEFGDRLVKVFRKGLATIRLILASPIAFLGHLLDAVKKGVGQFADRIWDHLKAGFMAWMFGALAEAGIELPKDFTLGSILKLVLSVLGITYARMREKAVKLVGERAVSILEKVFGFLHTLVTAGPAKLWEEMKEYLSDLKAQVIDALQSWVVTTIVKSAITKLVTMFNPVGAIVQAVITIYNVVMFFVENAKKILALVEAIVESVSAIASGAISSAANWIEQAMARAVPVVIGFLARLLGLGGLADKIKEIIKKVQGMVDRAVDKVIEKVVGGVRRLFATGKAAVKGALQWWRKRQKFSAKDGQQHDMFFRGGEDDAELLVASEPAKRIEQVLAERAGKKEGDAPKVRRANELAREMRALMRKTRGKKGAGPREYDAQLAKDIDTAWNELVALLADILGPGAPKPSKLTYALDGGRAHRVTASPLSLLSGNTKGTEASRSLMIPGWTGSAPVPAYNLVTDVFVRAHLVSYLLHGPGNVGWNLAAATKDANKALELEFEHKVARRIGTYDPPKKLGAPDLETVSYTTTVDYWAKTGPLAAFVKEFTVKVEPPGNAAGKPVKSESPSKLFEGQKYSAAVAPVLAKFLDVPEKVANATLRIQRAQKPKSVDDVCAALKSAGTKDEHIAKIREALTKNWIPL